MSRCAEECEAIATCESAGEIVHVQCAAVGDSGQADNLVACVSSLVDLNARRAASIEIQRVADGQHSNGRTGRESASGLDCDRTEDGSRASECAVGDGGWAGVSICTVQRQRAGTCLDQSAVAENAGENCCSSVIHLEDAIGCAEIDVAGEREVV